VTSVTTLDDGHRHNYQWFPAWLALAITAAALVLVVRALRTGAREDGRSTALTVERRALVYVTVPVGIYLTVVAFSGTIPGGAWVFEEGHWLAGQHFITNGYFPWRDYLFDHGLFQDTLRALVGMAMFGGSRWGAAMGDMVVWTPAYLLGLYYLAAYLAERWSLLFVIAAAALIAFGAPLVSVDIRFFLMAYIVLVLLAALRKPSWWRAALLGVMVAAQSILVPESGYVVPAVFVALLGYEVTHRGKAPSLLSAFRRTVAFSGGGLASLAVLLVVLALHHAVGWFVNYYVIFLDSHELAGGIPHVPWTPWTAFWAAAPLAGWLASIAYLATKVVQRRKTGVVDWLLVATAVYTVLYYGKWLGRADLHLLQSYAAAQPMYIVLAFLAVNALDRQALRLPTLRRVAPRIGGRAASATLLAAAAIVLAQPLSATEEAGPGRFITTAYREPWLPVLGYADAAALDPALYHDVQVMATTYLGKDHRIEDFSNEPGLFYFALGLFPPTRYYHIALAIPEAAQEDMIKQLEADPPILVVISNGHYGLPEWDYIANQVRHHTVAQWIYEHYRPLATVDTEVFFALKTANVPPVSSIASQLSQPPLTDGLYFQTQVCDWGHIADHLTVGPSGQELAAPTTVWTGFGAPAGRLDVSPPGGHAWADYRWLEVDTNGPLADDAFSVHQEANDPSHDIVFDTTPASSHRYLLHVGACGQWHGYASTPLQFDHPHAQPNLTAVRLLP
jgi:hypothetical protein